MADDREIRLYYFTAAEAAELAHCSTQYIRTNADYFGAVQWNDGTREQLMLPPDAIGKVKRALERDRRQ
ncbi:MAG: hypothetical protein AB1560_02030 [Pseudomonadota bacterium]